jgi:hypothetical protein
MICTVDMSFSFLGGSSLGGPINRLQNAISFNYFANTELYDKRADKIKVDGAEGTLVDGLVNQPLQKATDTPEDEKAGTDDGQTKVAKDQIDNTEADTTEEGNETLSEEDKNDISILNDILFFGNSDSDDDIRLTVKDLGGLSEGWGYKLSSVHLSTIEELKSKSPIDPLTDINDKGEILFEKIITYDNIGSYWFETQGTYDFQHSLANEYDNPFYDNDEVVECNKGNTGNVLERQVKFKIEFFKEGLESITKFAKSLLYKQTEWEGNLSGDTVYFYGGSSDRDIAKAEALGVTDIEISNDAKKDTVVPNDYMAMTNYINYYNTRLCNNNNTVSEEIFEDPNQDTTPLTDDEEAPI